MLIHRGFGDDQRPRLAALLWEGFSAKFERLLRDRDSAVEVLAPGLNPAGVVTAVDGDEIVGVMLLKHRDWPEPMDGRFRDWMRTFGVVSGAARLVAFGAMEERAAQGVLVVDGIAVAPEARGLGIGSRLMAEAETIAGELELAELKLEVVVENRAALRLYERLGYRVTTTTKAGPVLRRLVGLTAYHEMRKAL